jgi:hypothetical protein
MISITDESSELVVYNFSTVDTLPLQTYRGLIHPADRPEIVLTGEIGLDEQSLLRRR